MRSLVHWLNAVICACLLGIHLAATAQVADTPLLPAQAMIDALSRANEAVVGLRVSVAEDARSAETLGQRRRGSGVS